MKTRRRIVAYVLTLCFALSLSSCGTSLEEKVSIDGYENLDIKGFSGVTTDLIFSNHSCHKITLRDVNVQLNNKGNKVAILTLKDQIVIPRKSEGVAIPTMWRLHDVDALTALSMSGSILSGKIDENLKIDIDGEVKAGIFKRRVERKNMSLKSVMNAIKK